MTTDKIRTAEAMAPMLAAFHTISDRPLRSVRQVYTEGTLDRIVFGFGQVSLVVVADENDDSIEVTTADTDGLQDSGGVDGSRSEPWRELIGKPFGWGWVTVNQQGYCDGLLLSFGGIVPQVALNVIASSIKVATITAAG
jgi:hypothetical protein